MVRRVRLATEETRRKDQRKAMLQEGGPRDVERDRKDQKFCAG